jgi:hypothetical protein
MFSSKSVPWLVSLAVLFIALSPGVLLTVPNPNGATWYDVVTVGSVSTQLVVHSVVFALAWSVVRKVLKALLGKKKVDLTAVTSSASKTASSAASAVSTAAKKL